MLQRSLHCFARVGAIVATCVCAATEPPWQAQIGPTTRGPHPIPAPVVLDFDLSWNGAIDAGQVHLEFAPHTAKKSGAYVIHSIGTSQGLAASLFPFRFDFWSELHLDSLTPWYFRAVETDAKETVTTTTRYHADRVESDESAQKFRTGKTTHKSVEFKFNAVHDIFSAMLFVRSQPLKTGEHITLVVLPFDTPYLLHVQSNGSEIHGGHNAINLSVSMQKIDRTTLELLPYKKLKRSATLWLSDDADRIPIEIRAAVFIGDVRATLTASRKLK